METEAIKSSVIYSAERLIKTIRLDAPIPIIEKEHEIMGKRIKELAAAIGAAATEPTPPLTPLEEEMLAALRPFAEIAKERCVTSPEWPAREYVTCVVSVEDLRKVDAVSRTVIAKAESLKAQAAQAGNAEPQS